MSKTTRIVFIGLGGMGQGVHLPNFLHAPDCEIVAVCDARPKLASLVADRHHIPRHFSDHREMLEKVEADAAVVIMGPPAHVPIALDCMAAGLHVYTEKPPATSLADAIRLADAADEHGRCFQVGFMKRYDAGNQLAREKIRDFDRDEAIGDRQFARVHYFGGEWVVNYPWRIIQTDESPPARPEPDAFPAPDFMPGQGPKFDFWFQQFCHALDLIRYLWGSPTRVERAWFADWENNPYQGLFHLMIDEMPLMLETGWFDNHQWDEHYQVIYRRGSVRVLQPPPLREQTSAGVEVYCYGQPSQAERYHAAWDWAFRRQVVHFLKWIRGEAEAVSPVSDTVNDIYLGEQILRSAFESRPLDLDYPRPHAVS